MKKDVEYFELLEELEQIIKDAKQSLIGNKCSVDKAELLGIVNDLMEALPDEIKKARSITSEAKIIINTAREDAQRVLEDADAEADEIVKSAQSDADRQIKDAKEEADRILNNADAEAEALIREAQQKSAELVSAHQITQLATEQARETVDDAKRQAYEAKMGARGYVDDMLGDVEHTLMEYVSEIQACRKQFK
ncbi:MAG: hypothetical protein IJZ90_00930 [Clostridia bacterium]|nr:hypothetical protein [Clostridia bacterium]